MDALAIAQLVLRILLAALLIGFALSHPWFRVRKMLIETVIPARLAGSDPAAASARMVAIANGLLVVCALAGLALLAPWSGVRLGAGIAIAALALAAALVRFADSREGWSEPAFRGELALEWSASAVLPVLVVLAVL
ncbi:MAG: hypothetical protein ACQEWM_10890 [Actinomycetota bacterium]